MAKMMLAVVAFVLASNLASTALAQDRVDAVRKGSLLVFPKIELKWTVGVRYWGGLVTSPGVLQQDTIIQISNDFPEDVRVQFQFLNGDAPMPALTIGPLFIERAHPGWNTMDCEIRLTSNQPVYMSLSSGMPAGCQPLTVLDPGNPPGRPDPEVAGGRILRGTLLVWAVNEDGHEIRHNHLFGTAELINYRLFTSAKYNAYTFRACPEETCAHGAEPDATPGQMKLDGAEYSFGFNQLQFNFFTSGLTLPGTSSVSVLRDFDLTFHPLDIDFRQDGDGPVLTKAKFDIWNENENRFSGTERCINCWDQTLASQYNLPNFLTTANLGTNLGVARVDGIQSVACPLSVDASLLGILIDLETMTNVSGARGFATSAVNMFGQGTQSAVIRFDPVGGSDEIEP